TRMRPRISTLTPRESESLRLLAEGNSVKEIVVILGLGVKTVEAHKFNLMRKLDIHNQAQLVTYAIQKKIIKIPVNQHPDSPASSNPALPSPAWLSLHAWRRCFLPAGLPTPRQCSARCRAQCSATNSLPRAA